MKKLLVIMVMLVSSMGFAQQVQFDSLDAMRLREIVFYASPNGLSDADATLFNKIDKQLAKSGSLNLGIVPTKYLYKYADNLYYDYDNYIRSSENAARFLKIMKKIKETDPNFLGVGDSYNMKDNIETIKKAIK